MEDLGALRVTPDQLHTPTRPGLETDRPDIDHSTINHDLRDEDVPTIHDALIDAIEAGDAATARAETITALEQHLAAHRTDPATRPEDSTITTQ